jgi:hypothetical protein
MVVAPDTATEALGVLSNAADVIPDKITKALVPVVIVITCAVVNPT